MLPTIIYRYGQTCPVVKLRAHQICLFVPELSLCLSLCRLWWEDGVDSETLEEIVLSVLGVSRLYVSDTTVGIEVSNTDESNASSALTACSALAACLDDDLVFSSLGWTNEGRVPSFWAFLILAPSRKENEFWHWMFSQDLWASKKWPNFQMILGRCPYTSIPNLPDKKEQQLLLHESLLVRHFHNIGCFYNQTCHPVIQTFSQWNQKKLCIVRSLWIRLLWCTNITEFDVSVLNNTMITGPMPITCLMMLIY